MKILIICSSNVCRSPFAEYYLRRLVANDDVLRDKIQWIKSSAVFNKSKKLHSKAAAALQNEGFLVDEISAHKPSYYHFDKAPFKEADVIIGMSKVHKILLPKRYHKKFFTLSEIAVGKYIKIPDPFLLKTQEQYNLAMEPIKNYLNLYVAQLKKQLS